MLARATVPAIAYATDPLTVAELDRHPDAARLWATIERAREEMREEMDDLRQKVRDLQGRVEDAAFTLHLLHGALTGSDPLDDRSDEERIAHVASELLAAKQCLYEIAEEDL